MAAQTTQTTVPLHHRGMYEVIDAYGKSKTDFAAALVGRTITTTQLYEEIAWWSGLGPAADLLEGEDIPFDKSTSPFQKKFYPGLKTIGFETTDVALETEQYGKLKMWAKMFAQSHYITEQQSGADIINYMIDTGAKHLGIDGVPMISASHPTKTSTWSNRLSGDPHLGPLALADMMNGMMDQMAYRDYVFPQEGPFNLYVGTPNNDLAHRLAISEKMPGGNDNDKNYAGSRLRRVVCNPFITQKYFWLLRAAGGEQGLFKLKRGGMKIREGFDIRTNTNLMTATQAYLYAWSMANGIAGSAAAL